MRWPLAFVSNAESVWDFLKPVNCMVTDIESVSMRSAGFFSRPAHSEIVHKDQSANGRDYFCAHLGLQLPGLTKSILLLNSQSSGNFKFLSFFGLTINKRLCKRNQYSYFVHKNRIVMILFAFPYLSSPDCIVVSWIFADEKGDASFYCWKGLSTL